MILKSYFLLMCFRNHAGNIFGGRSGSYEQELLDARSAALKELEQRAKERGTDAVVGIDVDYEVLGPNGGMLMVTASGTAVKLE